MTAQEAAHKILSEAGKPLSAKEIAQIALSKGYVASSAKNPVFSIAGTIEKTIREDKYNSPRLIKVRRKIALPSMEESGINERTAAPAFEVKKRINVELPEKIIEDIQLANQAKLAGNYDDTVALLLQKGLSAFKSEIQKRVNNRLKNI